VQDISAKLMVKTPFPIMEMALINQPKKNFYFQ